MFSLLQLQNDQFLVGTGPCKFFKEPLKDSCFYYPDFFLNTSHPWIVHEKMLELSREALLDYLSSLLDLNDQELNLPSSSYSNKNFFYENFEDLQLIFKQKNLKKAVPFVFEEYEIKLSEKQALKILFNLLHNTKNKPLHIYGFFNHEEGLIGATPEVLFEYVFQDKYFINTAAIAGTLPKDGDLERFKQDPKMIAEHELVVTGILEELNPFGNIKKGKREVLILPKLVHLLTPIELTAEKIDFLSLIKALHPTPALGAYPKEEGFLWLKKYETKIPRKRFGAPFGCLYEGGKKAKCIVAIRNIQWDQKGLQVGAGCGVIETSQVEAEWNEICLKIKSIKEMMSLCK